MSWLCATQVLSDSSESQSDTPPRNGDIVGILCVGPINGETTDYKIFIGDNKIGRDPEACSIVLDNKTLSKVHAVIESEGPEKTFIYDVGSTNKTKIGEKKKQIKMKPNVKYRLEDGEIIIFGNVRAQFKIYGESSSSSSQSLLSPVINSQEHTNNQRESITESPDMNDSVFEADTQCQLDESPSTSHVFKVPQVLKPKPSTSSHKLNNKIDNKDNTYSLSRQASIPPDELANLNYSDIFDQPTQCPTVTTNNSHSKVQIKFTENLDDSDVYEMETQCQVNNSVNDSVFDQPTQMPISNLDDDDDDFVFEEATQQPVIEKEPVLDDSVFEQETHKPLNGFSKKDMIFDAETQVPFKKKKDSDDDDDDEIFNIQTQKPNDVFNAETQAVNKEKECVVDDEVFEEETQITTNGFSKNESIFEVETQMPGSNKFSDSSIFDVETQQPEKSLSALSLGLDDSESSIFGAETQFPPKKESSNDSNEILAALPDSLFEEPTQVPIKTPQSEKKRKRPSKHNNAALFKGKRRSANDKSANDTKDYLNDGQDDVLCDFMSKNSPVLEVKNEKYEFDDDLKWEDIPNEVLDPDTQTPGYKKRRSHLDSGIADERDDEDLTQSLSLDETVNDSGVKDKEDSAAKLKGSVNMVLSSSSDEDCDIANTPARKSKSPQNDNFKVPDNRTLEDSIPTQVLTNNVVNPQISSASQVRRELEDDIPTQVMNTNQNEDLIPTQPFKSNDKTDLNEDSIPTQIFNDNKRVVEASDDETDSDVELPMNKAIEDSDTESDVESVKVNEIERIETPTSVGSDSMLNTNDKSNDSFSMMKEIDDDSTNSLPNCKSPNLLEDKSDEICDLSPNEKSLINEGENAAILNKNNRRLSPTQILFDDEEEMEIREEKKENRVGKRNISPTQVMFDVEDDLSVKNGDVLRKSRCSPTQVLSDSDTDCEEDVSIKKEQQYEETQVLPLSPPHNYKPRVLTKDDAWMLGDNMKDSFKTPEKVKGRKSIRDNDSDDDWGPLSLEMPSTQDFQRTVDEKTKRLSPEKSISSSKRPRDSQEDIIKPKSKLLKNGDSPAFKAPRNLFDNYNCEVTIAPKQNESNENEIISEGRPKRTRHPTWKVLETSDEENSPLIRLPNRNGKKPCIIDDDSQSLDESNSPIVKLPKRKGKTKPLIVEDSQDEQNSEPIITRRRSARLQKSGSTSSCTSNSSTESSTKIRRTRNSKKKSYFEDQNVKVIFTSYVNDNKAEMIKQLGGEKVEIVKDANVVVTDKVRRTVKFLSALSLGLPIVTPDWVVKSNEANEFLDPWPYLLQDKDQEMKFGFNLKTSIEKARKKKLLKGYKVYATPNAKPPPPELYVVVEHCGGEPLPNPPDTWPQKTIVISSTEDESLWPSVKYRSVKIVHFEFLLTGVLQQKLDFKTYKLR